ncbi:MAG: PAS domain S-box protein [Oscillatoriaceae cyanobacterium Prado104]|jgi:PAS domain S-box-containing protein|nr:PAS domain S-box protein [Oscillatoriaceae cyanobacterium Prado104]
MFHEILYQEVTNLRQKLAHLEREMQSQTWFKKLQALMGVIGKIRKSLDLETIFKTTATEVRQLLNADRVAVYRFLPESEWNDGEVVSEDVLPQYSPSLGTKVHDHCFGEQFAANYAKGYVQAVSDIYKARLSPCHLKILKRFQIRANLVVPLLQGQHLWGLLCIHQCGQPRDWQEDEIEFAKQVGDHLAVAIYQAELHLQTQKQLAEIESAQQQLRDNEQKYHQILDSIADMVLVKGPGSKIVWANRSFRDYYGMSQEALQGIIDAPFANPDYTQQYVRDDAFVFETGQTLQIAEEPAARYDGEVRLFSTVKTPIRNEDGQVVMTVGVSRDMTERKQAEESIKASETKYRSLVETSQDMIWSIDTSGRYTFVNPAVKYIYGYQPEEIIGRRFCDFVMPEQVEKELKVFSRLLAGESIFQHESAQIAKDGSIKYLMFNAIAVYDENGNITGTTGTATDITDRKLAEAALQASEAKFRHFVENANDLIYEHSPTETFTYVSPKWTDLFGHNFSEIPGKSFAEFIHPEDLPATRTFLDRILATGRQQAGLEIRARRADGSWCWVTCNISPVKDSGGNIISFQGIARDITDRKLAEEALQRANAELEIRVEERTAELRQTLTALTASETKFRTIAATIPGALFQFCSRDGVGQVDYISDRIFDITGLTATQIMQDLNAFISRIHPEDLENYITSATEAVENLSPWHYEGRIIKPDGEIRWWQGVSMPTSSDNGETVFCGVLLDVTDRKQAETAIRESQRQLQAAQRLAHVGNWELDPATETVTWSEELFRIHGLAPALTAPTREQQVPLIHPEDLELWHTEVQRGIDCGIPFDFDFRLYRPDGTLRHINALGEVETDASGKTVKMFGTAMDITDRKNAEAALRQAAAELEDRVADRTAELRQVVAQLEQEISDRKQAEAELQHAQKFMESVLNTIPVGVVAKEVEELRFVLWNPAAEQLLGFRATEVLGKNDYDFFPTEQADLFSAKDREVLASRQILDIPEELIQNSAGETRIFHTKKTAILDLEGNPQYLLAITEDVTDRKRGELALRESEARLRQQADREKLLNNLTTEIRNSLDFDSILTVAVNQIRAFMQVDRCSFAWYRDSEEDAFWEIVKESRKPELPNLIGRYSAADFGHLGQQLLRLETLRVDDVEQISEAAWQQTVRSMGGKSVLVIPVQALSGVVSAISCSHSTAARPWTDSEVELLQAITVQLAIALNQADLYAQTDNKARELEHALHQLQRTQSQLIQSEKMSSLGQLVAGVAHEINNPVNFIYGNLTHAKEYTQELLYTIELYQKHYPEPVPEIREEIENIELDFLVEDLPKLLSSMKVGADRIQQIVASLRTFSRMDEAEMKAVNIHDGIDSTLMILQHRLKAKHDRPEIQVIKEYGKLPLVECYAGQLNQVFMNILSNALDALEERDARRSAEEIKQQPSRIRISTEILTFDRVIIRIADNGPGIPENVGTRLFDPFFTTKPVGKGTGMGLSISYQIVTERHGGSLYCNSAPGVGAEFAIEIPLKAN